MISSPKHADLCCLSGDKDDDDDDDADDKMQSSVLTGVEEGRQESQEQGEVDHSDFEMVVSEEGRNWEKNEMRV